MSHQAHEEASGRVQAPARCAVLTCSDTRTRENDRGGDRVLECLEAAGHRVVARRLTRESPDELDEALEQLLNEDIDLLVCTGGTGIARRDGTVERVRARLDLELDGFGELFRHLSFAEIGAAAMLSRATGGVVRAEPIDTLLFALPGSVGAIELAMTEIILPQLSHMRMLLGEKSRSR
ncbi:MAG: molybdenum cofactor biosynthesis protein MoaB [Phycisphaerales bacterium]|jgi:molybdenum cofactor biosynthesis protein B|nr:molybdenum cofactor biosynthesis protein MoaB [Phycisphaerales bacterium]